MGARPFWRKATRLAAVGSVLALTAGHRAVSGRWLLAATRAALGSAARQKNKPGGESGDEAKATGHAANLAMR